MISIPTVSDGLPLDASWYNAVKAAIEAHDAALVASRVGCRLRRPVQSIASATPTVISWNTEDEDTHGFITPTSTTIAIPSGQAGTYAITYRVAISSLTTAGRCFASINMTSGVTGTPTIFRSPFDANEDQAVVTIVLPLLAGDTFTADVFHSQGASRDADAWISCYLTGV